MRLAVACDHRGFEAKRRLLPVLKRLGHDVRDLGCDGTTPVDFPDLAATASVCVANGEAEVGILLDGSGVGMCISANKVDGIRAGCIHDEVTARRCREHDHCNVLCLACDLLSEDQIRTITEAFLDVAYGHGRHTRRVEKMMALEQTRGRPGQG